MMLRDLRYGVEPDDGENLRRIGRSLSGTVVTPRRSRLTATRSFVSVTSCPLPPPCGRAAKLHLPDDSRRGTWHIASPCALLPPPPSTVCLVSSFCPAFFSISNLSPSLSLSPLPLFFLFVSQRWSRLMSVPLPAYFLSSESLSLFHHYHLLHLLITNTFSSPPPSTASQVNTALSSYDPTPVNI